MAARVCERSSERSSERSMRRKPWVHTHGKHHEGAGSDASRDVVSPQRANSRCAGWQRAVAPPAVATTRSATASYQTSEVANSTGTLTW